jgi:aminoglycoside 3-N-acetyltransferase
VTLRTAIGRFLGERRKRALKSRVNQTKQRLVRTFLSYDAPRLQAELRRLGISATDTLLVHSNFEPMSGFIGAPSDLANAFVETVGEGNLLMVSIPFRGSAYDYLAQDKVFDVRKTLSMMGLVTEMFRRRPGTLRSLHPTHPVLAYGRDAATIVAGHEACLYPCGPGSPFEKFRALKGKILFFDVGFGSITFFHHVEHLLQDQLPFPVYADRRFTAQVVDAQGGKRFVTTFAFNKDVSRDAKKVESEMVRRGLIRTGRVGNSKMLLVTAEDVVTCMSAMVAADNSPYRPQ